MLTFPPELLLSVFARVDHATLNRLLYTSRTFRATAKQQCAQRCRLARSVFETCAQELRERVGSMRRMQTVSLYALFEGRRDGDLAAEMQIRMHFYLIRDRLRITVSEIWFPRGVIDDDETFPEREDEFIVWPTENRMERKINREMDAIPVPGRLVDYMCATCMHLMPNDKDMDIVCTTDAFFGCQ